MGLSMKYYDERLSDEEFENLFNEALYALDGPGLFFRKARHGGSFIRADC